MSKDDDKKLSILNRTTGMSLDALRNAPMARTKYDVTRQVRACISGIVVSLDPDAVEAVETAAAYAAGGVDEGARSFNQSEAARTIRDYVKQHGTPECQALFADLKLKAVWRHFKAVLEKRGARFETGTLVFLPSQDDGTNASEDN